MPDISIRIQVGDAIEVVQAIESNLENPSELMGDILLMMIRSTQLTFEQQGRPARWTPLAQSTIEGRLRKNDGGRAALKALGTPGTTELGFNPDNKAAKGKFGKNAVKAQEKYFAAIGSIQILRDTGRLLMGVGGGQSGDFETEDGFGIRPDKYTAVLGTNHPGAEALQFIIAGGRPFLLFQDQDEEDIMDASVQFVMGTGPYSE